MATKSDNSPWLAASSLALTLAGSWAANRVHKAEGKLRDAQVAAANSNRLSKNIERGAEAGLARFMQSVNNNRRLTAAGQQLATGTQNMIRAQDTMVTSSIEQQLREAERAGAYAANVASTGTGGNSVDMIDLTMRLKNVRRQAATDKNNKYLNYDMAQQLSGIMPQTVEGLDVSTVNAGMDYSTNMSFNPERKSNLVIDLLANPNMRDVLGLFGSNKKPEHIGQAHTAYDDTYMDDLQIK